MARSALEQRRYHRGQAHLVEQYLWLRSGWEAAAPDRGSDGVTFRGNHVHDNNGAGLWCDIECRNVVYEDNRREQQDIGIFVRFRSTR
jgi:hypothetical protein